MSALIFHINPEHAIVAMDTLATTPEGYPFFFTSKAYHIPHLRVIVAGTGQGKLICDFQAAVNTQYLLDGVEHLAEHAPALLTRIFGEKPETPSTVYLFGVSEKSGEIAAFALRSSNGFAAERLPPSCTAVKPSEGMEGVELNDLEDIPQIMQLMRDEQAKEPDPAKRLHIGGEIVLFVLSRDEFRSAVIHKFADADEQRSRMGIG